jgi:prepilin-type processing-associated H-X9-DG protein
MKCSNNLKQLGLGLHNHHDTYGEFPAARMIHAIINSENKDHSWTPQILPFIEQDNLFRRYDFNLRWDEGANTAAGGPIREKVNIFLCPSAPQSGRHNNRGCLDYAATTERTWPNTFVSAQQAPFVTQGDPQFIGVLGDTDVVNGAIRKASRTFASVSDGTSNTMILAECAGRNRRFVMGREDTTQTWTAGPVAINCVNNKEIYAFHPSGANILMCDGSVRFLKQSTSLDIVLQLLTRDRGEVNSPN